MLKVKSFLILLKQCIAEDFMTFRTRVFVGFANLLPDFALVNTFLRPLLISCAGAKVEFPSRIRRPLFINYASGISIRRYAFINQGCRMEGRKSIIIGAGAQIGPFCCFENVNHRMGETEGLPVIIGSGAWIGCGSIILPGAEVGDGAVVAAGSVVRGRIPPGEMWGGVPARCIRASVQTHSRVGGQRA